MSPACSVTLPIFCKGDRQVALSRCIAFFFGERVSARWRSVAVNPMTVTSFPDCRQGWNAQGHEVDEGGEQLTR